MKFDEHNTFWILVLRDIRVCGGKMGIPGVNMSITISRLNSSLEEYFFQSLSLELS